MATQWLPNVISTEKCTKLATFLNRASGVRIASGAPLWKALKINAFAEIIRVFCFVLKVGIITSSVNQSGYPNGDPRRPKSDDYSDFYAKQV